MSVAPAVVWPDRVQPEGDYYPTLEGRFPRVTAVLKVLGLGTEALIRWAANQERTACIAAAAEAWRGEFDEFGELSGAPLMGSEFGAKVNALLGQQRAHQRQLEKAGDIGTETHKAVERYLAGKPIGELSSGATVGFMAWRRWFEAEGLTPIQTEQTVWHRGHGFAGTVDLFAMGPDGYELLDWKTSTGIYEGHHVQAATYVEASPVHIVRARIVRIPKRLDDPVLSAGGVQVVDVGDLWKRRVAPVTLFSDVFLPALKVWNCLKREAA